MLEKCLSAICQGDTEVALSLFNKIPVDERNNCGSKGYNALHLAIRTENIPLVAALLQFLNLHTLTATGEGVLHLAVAVGNLKIMKRLLAAGATVGCCTPNGNTPLHIAACSLAARDGVIVSTLIEAGAILQLNAKNLAKQTPLMLACQQGNYTIAHMLMVTYGAQPPAEAFLAQLSAIKPQFVLWLRPWMKTPVEPVQFSVQRAARSSSLYLAVQQGRQELITTLFHSGADPLARCGYPDTPFQLAKKLGNTEALALFKTLRLPTYSKPR